MKPFQRFLWIIVSCMMVWFGWYVMNLPNLPDNPNDMDVNLLRDMGGFFTMVIGTLLIYTGIVGE